MSHTVPDGPTDARLMAMPEEHTTIVAQPGFAPPPGVPAAEPGAEPTSSGRLYATGEGRYHRDAVSGPAVEASSLPDAGVLPGADRGRTTIADEVVERVIDKIVALAVAEITGVRGLFASEEQPVSVRLDGDQTEINISVQVEFGYAVHEVVAQLRSAVIGQVERLLSLTITEVNVLVADVTFDPVD